MLPVSGASETLPPGAAQDSLHFRVCAKNVSKFSDVSTWRATLRRGRARRTRQSASLQCPGTNCINKSPTAYAKTTRYCRSCTAGILPAVSRASCPRLGAGRPQYSRRDGGDTNGREQLPTNVSLSAPAATARSVPPPPGRQPSSRPDRTRAPPTTAPSLSNCSAPQEATHKRYR